MIVKEREIVCSEPASFEQAAISLQIENGLVVIRGYPYDLGVLSKPDVRQLIDALSCYMMTGQFTAPRKTFIERREQSTKAT